MFYRLFWPFFLLQNMSLYSLVSWNVNGTKNVSEVPYALKLVNSADIILLQETFETKGAASFKPKGFLHFSNEAVATGGRPSGGLSTLIRLSKVSGVITRLQTPFPWVLALRWVEPGRTPLILLNIYMARFSAALGGFNFDAFRDFFFDLRSVFIGEAFICGGDWNADPFRMNPSPTERKILAFIQDLVAEGFSKFPSTQIPTFQDRGNSSTIDFVLASNQSILHEPRVGPQRCCQHFPIIASFRFPPVLSTVPEG